MQSFQPPRRFLMGPGPSDISPRVLSALARPTIGHLDPAFQGLMEEIKAALSRLVVLAEEGVAAAHARHRRMHLALVAGLEAAGLKFLAAPGDRLPQLNAVLVPEGIDEAEVRARLLSDYDLEIGAGLGPLKGRIWRIGLMGSSATAWHVRLCLTALTDALCAQNYPDAAREALAAAEASLAA